MSDRQYGITPGYVVGGSAGRQQQTPPMELSSYSSTSPYRDNRQISPSRHHESQDYDMAEIHHSGSAQALRDIDNLYSARIPEPSMIDSRPTPPPHMSSYNQTAYDHSYSSSSLTPLAAANPATGYSTPPRYTGSRPGTAAMGGAGVAGGYEQHMSRGSYYGDGYDGFDPSSIADDGDDDFEHHQPQKRRSRLALGGGGAAAAGAGAGTLGLRGGGDYGPVGQAEKSEWLRKQSSRKKRLRWLIGGLILFLVVGGIAGGVVGGILANNGSGNKGGSSSPTSGSHSGGDLTKDSSEIKALMNNKNLHKVFPAVDYTPFHAQYPACEIKNGGPDQNNVTIDIALLSQLAPAVRLYGTDCNQTELVLEAISRLDMKDTMKVWLGVYLDGNSTTNDRQIAKMWNILDNYDHSSFAGIIVGNEVLFSEYLTEAELSTQLESVRKNVTAKGINLPVATADLGDNWTQGLSDASDIVMANIHPFFAGTVAKDSAGWAYTFWHGKDVPLKTAATGSVGSITYPTQIIAEIGWPSEGGNDCGDATDPAFGCTSDTDGAVASVDNMNTFMDGWVCGALNNGTTFFWFSAFDEPWKHQFDTAHNKWEPYWGLFDQDRNFKDGLVIPDCGGKTADKPY